ncbi:MAG: hypothetical protein WC999_07335 [Hydrogenophaga sp.]
MSQIITYKENPSIALAKENTKHGVKTIFGKKEHSTYHILAQELENKNETEDTITFSKKQIVDQDQFVKLYIAGFEALSNLKNSTKLVYTYIFNQIRQEVGKDIFYFSFKNYESFCEIEKISKLSKATFHRSMNELMEKEVIFKSDMSNLYYINIAYVFNGDRLKFIQEYELEKTKKAQ